MRRPERLLAALVLVLCAARAQAQAFPLGEGPWTFATHSPEGVIKVSVVATGISHAWGMVFLPSGSILIAERGGAFRLIRDGKLVAEPLQGAPEVTRVGTGGLMDIALHPDFASNRLVYFSYTKPGPAPAGSDYYATTALGRGRLNEAETALTDIEDIFVADAWSTTPGGHGSRLRFAPDGTLFMSSPFRRDFDNPQNLGSHISKLLRLNDDGSVPANNPFLGSDEALPEIWTVGHRAIEGLVFHPVTGELWASEHGPQGGDELNIIRPGANYGWPLVSYGRDYDGSRVSQIPWMEGMEQPELFWVPSIATSGMVFYTGERFPEWQGDLFVGSLMTGRIPGTGHIERIEFNAEGEQKRERLLTELKQRVRDVQQGPDGLIYVLTEEENGALLVLEPVP